MATTVLESIRTDQIKMGTSYENQNSHIHTLKYECNNNELIRENDACVPLIHNTGNKNVSTTNGLESREEKREKLGGNGILVLVDCFPDGYRKFNRRICVNDEHGLILGFAAIAGIPPKYSFKSLPNSVHDRNSVLETIRENVHPDSTLIIDDSFGDILQQLKLIFSTVVTVGMLERHNTIEQNVTENLKLVWQEAVFTCDNVNDIGEVEVLLEFISN